MAHSLCTQHRLRAWPNASRRQCHRAFLVTDTQLSIPRECVHPSNPCRRPTRVHAAESSPSFSTAAPSHLAPDPHAPSTSSTSPAPPYLRVSRRIAASRAAETRRHRAGSGGKGDGTSGALFLDPYAELLATGPAQGAASAAVRTAAAPAAAASADSPAAWDAATGHDVVATAHLDRLLLAATSLAAVNRITQGDYRQVVLVGDAMDTRPFRLPWPPGTAIFVVAPAEAHAAAEAALASPAAAAIAAELLTEATAAAATAAPEAEEAEASGSGRGGGGDGGQAAVAAAAEAGARSPASPRAPRRPPGPRPPPGCLLRRVAVDLKGGCASLPDSLAAAGFRADRLSVWAVQGLEGLGLGPQDVEGLLASAGLAAAYHSLLVGELPSDLGGREEAANALADAGLLGAPIAFGGPDSSYGVWRLEWGPPADPRAPQRWLFAAQQTRLSGAQMDTYAAHRAVAEELDEDYFDNFS